MQIQQTLSCGGKCCSQFLPVTGFDVHGHGPSQTVLKPLRLGNNKMIVRTELSAAMDIQKLLGCQQPDLVSRRGIKACPASQL